MALCRSLLIGVFYEFTFALLLIDYFFLFYNLFQLKDYLKKEEPARMPTLLQTTKANRSIPEFAFQEL